MASEKAAPVLTVEGLHKRFGGLTALADVSLEVGQREVIGLIGPNGAGKTTAINLISGFMKPDSGKVWFHGQDITGRPPPAVAGKGLARTFQIGAFFEPVTVMEHVLLACMQARRANPLGLFFKTPKSRDATRAADTHARELLALVNLSGMEKSFPRELSHGHRQWLALSMALALDPSLLLLDEPLSGMNAAEIDGTLQLLKRLQEQRGLSILLIEHNMRAVMSFCDRIVVLNFGRKISEGTPARVSRDSAVIEAYLGGDDATAA